MAFNYSRGAQIIGDLSGSDDSHRNTGIDFEDDEINLITSGSVRLQVSNDGIYIPDTAQDASLFVSGGIQLTPGNQEGIRFANKGGAELNFISFQEGSEGGSYNARMGYNSEEYLFIAPGRGGDFFLNTGKSSGNFTYPFSIMDDGTAKFTKGLESSSDRSADLAPDIAFYVSGTTDGNNNAVFVGNVVMSGSLKVGNAFTFPTTDGTNKQVLSTNGSGVVTWEDQEGGGQLTATSDSKILMAHLSSDWSYTTSGANEFQTVPFNNVLKNTFDGNDFNTSNYTFTAPEEGFYFINLSMLQQNINTDTTQYQVFISSSADWADSNGSVAFRGYFPGAMAETTTHAHRLDRIVHLSGSDTIAVRFRNIRASTESGTSIHSGKHTTFLTIQKLEYVKREEIVVTGSTSLALDSSYNGGTVIITPLAGDITYTLPSPKSNFKVKFLAGSNLVGGDVIFKTKKSSSKIFGLLYRVSFGGDSDTGYDTSPKSYSGAGHLQFAGAASEEHYNTITVDDALQGSDIDFYSDGVYWYVRGTVVATAATAAAASTITFSSGSY